MISSVELSNALTHIFRKENLIINYTADNDDYKENVLRYYTGILEEKSNGEDITDDDFDEPAIQFTKLKTINENQMKIIYGCIDFNAYVNIYYEEPKPLF